MDNYVDKTGNETISGLKKFTETIHVINNNVSGILLEVPGIQWVSLNVQAQNSDGAFLTLGDFSNFIPLFLGSSNKVNSAVTTVSHGSNYVRFGNGIQICWGYAGSNEQLITFPQPFKDTNYSITVTGGNVKNEAYPSLVRDESKTSTSVKIYCQYLGKNYIVVGYWY